VIASLVLATAAPAQLRKLRPSQHFFDYDVEGPAYLHVSRISRHRKLASIGDTLYMLDRRNRILWKWSSDGRRFTDHPIIDSTDTIYVVGGDLMWVAIDARTGQPIWNTTTNGRASYWQIGLYKKDMYFVATNMSGYRDSLRDKAIEDDFTLCRGNDVLWETHIPANSRIKVLDNRVFVVFKQGRRIVRWPLRIPSHFGKPIRHVSFGHAQP
jgi:hypothetical protein